MQHLLIFLGFQVVGQSQTDGLGWQVSHNICALGCGSFPSLGPRTSSGWSGPSPLPVPLRLGRTGWDFSSNFAGGM